VLSAALKQAVAWGWIGHIFEVVEQPRALDAGKRGWANLPARHNASAATDAARGCMGRVAPGVAANLAEPAMPV
jgi:hypothetical protein